MEEARRGGEKEKEEEREWCWGREKRECSKKKAGRRRRENWRRMERGGGAGFKKGCVKIKRRNKRQERGALKENMVKEKRDVHVEGGG